jgi:uncharacterized protein YaiI (UPF0178 family)
MALGKKAYAIHQNGWQYTAKNIDRLLMERHMAKKARRSKKKLHLKGPAKRTEEDDDKFAAVFRRRCWREKGTNNCCPEGLLPRFDGKV